MKTTKYNLIPDAPAELGPAPAPAAADAPGPAPAAQLPIELGPVPAPAALPEAIESDRAFYRILGGGAVAVAIIAALGCVVLPYLGAAVPEGLIALGSGALGAIGGVLVVASRSAA